MACPSFAFLPLKGTSIATFTAGKLAENCDLGAGAVTGALAISASSGFGGASAGRLRDVS